MKLEQKAREWAYSNLRDGIKPSKDGLQIIAPITMSEFSELLADFHRQMEAEKWISVEDELPPDNTEVLAACYNGTVSDLVLYKNKRWFYQDRSMPEDVTHWQPIPEPPKQ